MEPPTKSLLWDLLLQSAVVLSLDWKWTKWTLKQRRSRNQKLKMKSSKLWRLQTRNKTDEEGGDDGEVVARLMLMLIPTPSC
jgi:hypothetical protein